MEEEALLCETDETPAALIAVSAVFASLGRMFVCLDREFRVLHVSEMLAEMAGQEAARTVLGRPAEDILGAELFGPDAELRQILERGERREGWRASLRMPDGLGRLMSMTATPFVRDRFGICDPRVRYIVVLRPAEEDPTTGTAAPTVFGGMIARSAAMSQIFQLVENLQASDATILLTGESGTGKEVLARAIHLNSPRRNGQFVAINCAALPGELLESELFGHARGAFTGAVRDRVGRFELASGGTLFLDEIGDVPLHLQVKLLRVLQDQSFERVGESHSRRTNARIIAATNVDLRRAVAEGRFREDLYYRLRVVPIEIPPLRTRREDVDPLARYLLARVASRHGRELRFSPEAVRALLRYPWPGNVRELENAIEYAVAVGRGQTIQPEDLPVEVTSPASELPGAPPPVIVNHLAELPADAIRRALETNHWQREATARALGVSRTTLWRRMRELGL